MKQIRFWLLAVVFMCAVMMLTVSTGEEEISEVPATPTPDVMAINICQEFYAQMVGQRWIPTPPSPTAETIVKVCTRELVEENVTGLTNENAFLVGQHIIKEIDKEGVALNDWRGMSLASLFAKVVEQNKLH